MLEIRNKLNQSSFARAFIVTFLFVTLASGLFWLDFFRSYSTEVTVLVVSHSSATENSSSVADNMAELTKTLSFYDRLLTENDSIDDGFIGYAPDKRKENWNNVVSVTKQNESGVLIIRANGDTPEKSRQFALQTAQTMFSVAGLYYNVKTDVDMRIVDGPLVSYTLQKPFLYVGTILFTSLSLTSLFFFLLRIVPELIGKKKMERTPSDTAFLRELGVFDELDERHAYPEYSANDYTTWIDPKKFIPEKPQALSFERSAQEETQRVSGVKHASAPANLPIASDEINLPVADETSLLFEFEPREEDAEVEGIEAESFEDMTTPSIIGEMLPIVPVSFVVPEHRESASTTHQGEPTQEDYKRRLNELLANVK